MSSAISDRTRFGAGVVAWLCAGAACTSQQTPEGVSDAAQSTCFVGDSSKPPEIRIVYRDAAGRLTEAENGKELALLEPPQGGKVMLVGVRARNLDGCGLMLAAALIDPETEAVIALERRPVQLEADGAGWLTPKSPAELSNYSNLPACPHANLTRAIEGGLYEVRVSVTDGEQRMAEASLKVIPTCAEPDLVSYCHCECAKDYTLGGQCEGT